jgi:hypothetical protein
MGGTCNMHGGGQKGVYFRILKERDSSERSLV